MLADGLPSCWEASQTIQRAASIVASSSLNVAVQTTSRMPRVAERGLVVDDERVALDVDDAGQEREQLAGRRSDTGRGHGRSSWGSRE